MPEEVFDGIILGGFHIFQVNVDESEQTGMIKNRFAFVIGVKLRITDIEIQPDLTLNEVQPALINYWNERHRHRKCDVCGEITDEKKK